MSGRGRPIEGATKFIEAGYHDREKRPAERIAALLLFIEPADALLSAFAIVWQRNDDYEAILDSIADLAAANASFTSSYSCQNTYFKFHAYYLAILHEHNCALWNDDVPMGAGANICALRAVLRHCMNISYSL